MPKQKLGTGNKRAVLQSPGTSYTSRRALRLQQRRARALDDRLQGRSYKAIGEAMKIHPATARRHHSFTLWRSQFGCRTDSRLQILAGPMCDANRSRVVHARFTPLI